MPNRMGSALPSAANRGRIAPLFVTLEQFFSCLFSRLKKLALHLGTMRCSIKWTCSLIPESASASSGGMAGASRVCCVCLPV